jgi:hypothetical protein
LQLHLTYRRIDACVMLCQFHGYLLGRCSLDTLTTCSATATVQSAAYRRAFACSSAKPKLKRRRLLGAEPYLGWSTCKLHAEWLRMGIVCLRNNLSQQSLHWIKPEFIITDVSRKIVVVCQNDRETWGTLFAAQQVQEVTLALWLKISFSCM